MAALSDRVLAMAEPETIAMSRRSRELRSQGIDVINLSLGEPDFATPDFIKQAAKQAIDDNYSYYTPVAGYADVREAIALKFKRDNNVDYSPEQIVVSTGAKQSIANAMLALVNPGDEVIIPTPFWVTYAEIVKMAGGVPVYVNTTIEQNFKFTASQIEAAISPKTKLMIFSSPCNPTGTVMSHNDLAPIAELLSKHPEIYIISDEIYEHINFVGQHVSIAQFDAVKNQTLVINGVSKAFAMTGWRIGYMAAPVAIAKACDKIQGQFTSAASSIAQRAAMAAALANPAEVCQPMRNTYLERRDLMLGLLKDIPQFKCNVPDGAFYIFPNIEALLGSSYNGKTLANSNDVTDFLINVAHVSLVPGSAFGNDTCMRISIAASNDKLTTAAQRIQHALTLLS